MGALRRVPVPRLSFYQCDKFREGIMIFVPFYSIVVNGSEVYTRESFTKAQRKAAQMRSQHGPYAVWIRPHFKLVPVA